MGAREQRVRLSARTTLIRRLRASRTASMGGFEKRDPHGGITGAADGAGTINLAGLITPRRQMR